MKRRTFIKKAGIGTAGLIGAYGFGSMAFSSSNSPGRRPNILFITTDYHAGEEGPSLGNPFLYMPNFDRLCKQGVVFERHYCTAPISMPSRYTLISGQYPHSHGRWDNGGSWVPERTPLLMEHLAQGGYNTIGIGKMHFHPRERMAGFHHRVIADGKNNLRINDDYAKYLADHGLSRLSYLEKQTSFDIFGVYDWPFAEEFHIDHYVGRETVHAIESYDNSNPWFIWSSFNGPHNPWDPPARCSDRYKRMDLPKARMRPGELNDKPLDHTRLRYNYTRAVADRIDQAVPEEKERLISRLRAGHYGGLSFIDEQIGLIINALESQGQLDNTIIIFSGDHGCELGDHHNIHKGLFYERSARVPMVVWSPQRYSPARVDSYSSHVDLFPTFLSMAGIGVSSRLDSKLEGVDLMPVINGRKESAQPQAFNEIRGGTNIVTDDWKFSIYPRDGSGELYDRMQDPDELYNLFDDPEYREVRRELTDRLVAFHPPLKDQIERMSPVVFIEKEVYTYNGGDNIPSFAAPYQAGKAINVKAYIDSHGSPWPDGPLFASYVGGVHGYALYIKDGYLCLGFRRWSEDTIIISPEKLPGGSFQVGASVSREGVLAILVDGKTVSSGKIEGPLQVQEGHERIMAPRILVGHSDGPINPIGEYKQDQNLSDYIFSVELRLDNS